jgi:lysophospholipase L1-like esterase
MILERIEWTNTWREDCTNGAPRVLLIGDSITNGYKSVVHRHLAGRAGVTAFATSKAIDNPFLWEELLLLAKQEDMRYAAIQVNNGLHFGGLSVEEYEKCYTELVEKLLAAFPDTPLVLALSTPITKNGETDVLAEQNAAVLEKNEAVLRIAKKYNLPVHDLYAAVVGKAHLRSADGYHYNAEGYEILGGLVAEGILALL